MIDDVTRKCLQAVLDTSISGLRVVRELAGLVHPRGAPKMMSATRDVLIVGGIPMIVPNTSPPGRSTTTPIMDRWPRQASYRDAAHAGDVGPYARIWFEPRLAARSIARANHRTATIPS